MNHKYSLRYDVQIENDKNGYTKDQAEGKVLTDALLVFSILFPEDGSYSQKIVHAWNGKKDKELSQKEIFKVLVCLALQLENGNKLNGWHKVLVKEICNFLREIKSSEQIKNDMA